MPRSPRSPSPPPPAARPRRRRLAAALLLVTAGAGLLGGVAPPPAGAQPGCAANAATGADAGDEGVLVVQVSGRLDPVLVDYVDDQIGRAERACALTVVLQLNSGGAVGNEDGAADLATAVAEAGIPVAVWVGPSGSRATGAAVELLAAADQTAVAAPGASIEVTRSLLEARDVAPTDLGDVDVGDRISAGRAVDLDLVDSDIASIGDFLLSLPGFESEPAGEPGQRQPVTDVAFTKLPILGQLTHTVASPAVAYLLFVIGLALLLFELFTAGVGVAGVVGAGSVLLGCYGLASLPTRPIGVALLLLAMFGYAVDVQTGVPRVWSGIATVAFVLGSVTLFDGLSVSWITLLVAVAGMTLGMLAGMPTMVRSRFATPTIGREWMVGELGRARTAIAPDGVVIVRDAPWRARTNRATPIDRDDSVRVVAIEGLVLEVEPESGGAKDYRERAKQRE
jgi:membrane-bound serine protease (ClpP class)